MGDLYSTVSFCGGGGGGGGGGVCTESNPYGRGASYGASPGSVNGSYRDGGHMQPHGGIQSALGPALAVGAAVATGSVSNVGLMAAGIVGGYFAGDGP